MFDMDTHVITSVFIYLVCFRLPLSLPGELGAGSHDRFTAAPQVPLRADAPYAPANADVGDEKVYHPGNSGGVLFSPPHFPNGVRPR